MGRKGVKKQFWLSREQAEDLRQKAACTCLTESALIRMLLSGYHPPEAPGEDFYKSINKLIEAAEKMYTLAEMDMDSAVRKDLMDISLDLKRLSLEMRRRYLTGERNRAIWL